MHLDWGLNPQLSYVPWPEIEPTALCCMGWCSNQLTRTATETKAIFFDPIYYSIPFYCLIQSMYIWGNYWWMRISYNHFIFCFLAPLCLQWFFSFVFPLFLFCCIPFLFSSVSSFFFFSSYVSRFWIFCVWLPLDLWKRKFQVNSSPFSFERVWSRSSFENSHLLALPLLCLYCHKLSLFILQVCWWYYL